MKKVKSLLIVLTLILGLILVSCSSECEHNYQVSEIITEGTCTTDGEVVKKCTKCGDAKNEVVHALGHEVVDATCLSVKHCVNCGENFGTELSTHLYDKWDIYKEPSCDESGTKKGICTVCGKTEFQAINPLGHDYTEWNVTKIATCTENGSREKTCNNCQEVVVEEIIAEHQYGEWEIIQNSTCQNVGLMSHKCSECENVEREEIPVSEHIFESWNIKTSPSCVCEGTEQSICINCNESITRPIDLVDHQYGEWIVQSNASCSGYGIKEHECSVCEKIEQVLIEQLDHQFIEQNEELLCQVCHQTSEQYSKLKEAFTEMEIKVDGENGINLPAEINGIQIIWKSYTPSIALDDGTVYSNEHGKTAIYKATLEIEGLQVEFSKEVVIPILSTSSIDWCWDTYYGRKIPEQTISNINYLWKNYANDACSVVGYKSSNTDIISDNGVINQQIYDQYATVTCSLKVGKVIKSYSREVKVLAYTPNQRLEMVVEWLPSVIQELQNNQREDLPLTHELWGTTISWFSLEAGVVAGNGVFVKPLEQKDVILQCTVSSGMYNRDLEFMLENIGGNTSKLEQLTEWMKGQIPTRILGTKNFVLESDAFDYQIRTNDGGVLNLIDGQYPEVDRSMLIDINKQWTNNFYGSGSLGTKVHPELTQDVLDRMMYTGYKKPNEQNILWIVVHESGMPRKGNDALLLAKVQMESALGQRDREASWNYQVDENKIYQSFEDEVICWHASDGTRTPGGGNNNGIGIEMCINEDGNYDGAMHMDAKLIAMLLTKYNLKLENVKRHFDFAPDKKQCPYYMIETGRWNEFLNLVDKEYTAISLLKDAKVTWTVTTDDNSDTEEVLNQYFEKGGSTLWYSKKVYQRVTLHITMTVEYEGQVLTHSNDLTLYPNV